MYRHHTSRRRKVNTVACERMKMYVRARYYSMYSPALPASRRLDSSLRCSDTTRDATRAPDFADSPPSAAAGLTAGSNEPTQASVSCTRRRRWVSGQTPWREGASAGAESHRVVAIEGDLKLPRLSKPAGRQHTPRDPRRRRSRPPLVLPVRVRLLGR